MEITATALSTAIAPEPPQAATESTTGFADVLGSVQSGAPPGTAPPTTGRKVGEEVAKPRPNANSQNPDFPPTAETKHASDKEGDPLQADGKKGASVQVMAESGAIQALLALTTLIGGTAFHGQVAAALSDPTAGATAPSVKGASEIGKAANAGVAPDITFTPSDLPPAPPSATPIMPAASATSVTNTGVRAAPKANSTAAPTIQSGVGATPPVQTDLSAVNATLAPTVTAATAVSGASEARGDKPARDGVNIPRAESIGKTPAKSSGKQTVSAKTEAADPSAKIASKSGETSSEEHEGEPQTHSELVSGPLAGNDTKAQTANAIDEKASLKSGEVKLVVRQIADRIQLLAATRPKSGVTIQLQPAKLGTITVSLKSIANSIEAKISASNENVRDALSQNRTMLGQAMEQRGLRLESVSVSSQPQTSTSANRQPQQQQNQQAKNTNPAAESKTESGGEGIRQRQHRISVGTADGVDLWI